MDLEDQRIEFDRLLTDIDRQAIVAYAQHRSASYGNHPEKTTHLRAVAELSRRYADVYYDNADFLEKRYYKQICEAAGFLHEVLQQGCTFEDLVGVADEAIARTVAGLTPDPRLPVPKRVRLLANQVGLGGAAVQIVKLADLRHDCLTYQKLVETEPRQVQVWLQEAGEVSGCLHQLTKTVLNNRIRGLKTDLAKLDLATCAYKRRTS